jgi:hypothetical protein
MKIYDFKKGQNGFNYFFEKSIEPNTTILLKIPPVSSNKRGINDIGFACEEGITLYATISSRPEEDNAIWQEINSYDEINKTTSYIKIENTSDKAQKVNIRVIMN